MAKARMSQVLVNADAIRERDHPEEAEKYAASFDESKHTRADDGKFGSGSGSVGGDTNAPKPKSGKPIGIETQRKAETPGSNVGTVSELPASDPGNTTHRHGARAKAYANTAKIDALKEGHDGAKLMARGRIIQDPMMGREYRITKVRGGYAFQSRHTIEGQDDKVNWETSSTEKRRGDIQMDAADTLSSGFERKQKKAQRMLKAIETNGESEGMSPEEFDEAIERESYAR